MKYLLFVTITTLLLKFSYAQKIEPFTVKGDAKLIATWNSKKTWDNRAAHGLLKSSGTLINGDKIQIGFAQSGFNVSVIHSGEEKQLVQDMTPQDVKGREGDSTIVKVYQYDFGQDGEKEIIVVYSSFFSSTQVKVFRYSGGLAQLVGNFNAQFEIILDKNIIGLPIGSQGEVDEYIYRKGVFCSLVYHDPKKK